VSKEEEEEEEEEEERKMSKNRSLALKSGRFQTEEEDKTIHFAPGIINETKAD